MAELQTDYDIKGVIDDLKQNKYSDDEIKGFLKDKFGDQTVQMYFPAPDAMTINSPAPTEFQGLTAPVAAGLAAAGTAATIYGAKKLKDRFLTPKTEAPKIEPTFGPVAEPTVPQTSIEKQLGGLDINTLPKDQRELINTLNEAERRRTAKQQQATSVVRQQIDKPGTIATTTAGSPVVPPVAPIATPEVPTVADIGKQAVGVAPVEAPATVQQVAAEVAPPPTAPAEEGKKKGRPTKEAQAKAMEGLTFRQDLGPGDNWLFNSFGAEGRKAILSKYNEGNPAGSYENAQQIFKRMQEERVGPGRSELPRDIAKERGVPPPETNYGKLGKTAKMAGVAGLALTAAQLAQAKNASQARQTVGEALLPLGLTPSTLAEGTLPPEIVNAMMAERQKLGSPFRSVPPPR